ncbi:exonuclease domain-containing protein [Nocardia sp. CA-107356]|uniref:exonuclease domain-containing protein n=1 Tax=Nocardia sp. CA-107356 TaxID=3239972 RepID=UPI003D912A9D
MLMQGNPRRHHAPFDAGFGSFTIVDVETSGLRAGAHRVLSVAALTLEGDGSVTREFHTLVDPGCDPGPVHIHGLTRDILRGWPPFEDVREQLSGLLTDRVMVAHNAQFDYGFLADEFTRAGAVLPVARRLCTLALARRVSPPTPDYKLGTLASYYGVQQAHAHNALDDARVLAGVLRALIADAAGLGIAPPLLACPPKENYRSSWGLPQSRSGPKVPCEFTYPGRLETGGRLVQGMKVAITGDTVADRVALIARAEAAGLEVSGAVSRRTSVLVTNSPNSGTGKARKAIECGTPVVGEAGFLKLLEDVLPGRRKDAAGVAETVVPRKPVPKPAPRVTGPLSGLRVLVLGGTHDAAVAVRARIAELGGSVAVNMSASVTDVLALSGAHTDRRYAKATELGLRIHGPELLDRTEPVSTSKAATATEAMMLARGQVIDLPIAERGTVWNLRASWAQSGSWDVDLVAFLLDGDEQVVGDEDFVFYNQPESAGARLVADGPNEQSLTLALDDLQDHCRRIVVAAALDGSGVTFGDVGAIEIEASPGIEGGIVARSALDAATEERTLLLAEVYLRGASWRLRAVGQGYPTELATLARGYGVDVAD